MQIPFLHQSYVHIPKRERRDIVKQNLDLALSPRPESTGSKNHHGPTGRILQYHNPLGETVTVARGSVGGRDDQGIQPLRASQMHR